MTLPSTGIIGHWSPSHQDTVGTGSGSTLSDYSASGNDGSLVNGASWVTDTDSGGRKAIYLDGSASDNRVDLFNLAAVLTDTQSLSFSCWVKFASLSADTRITTRSAIAAPHVGAAPTVDSNGGTGLYTYHNAWYLAFAATLSVDTWYHIGLTYRKDTTWRGRVYLDGVAGTEIDTGQTINLNWGATGTWRLGGKYGDIHGARLNGYLDDVILADHVMTAANFAALAATRNPYAPAEAATASGFNAQSSTGFRGV